MMNEKPIFESNCTLRNRKASTLQPSIFLIIIILFITSCSPPDNLPPPVEQEVQQPPSGPLAVNCVLTPEFVQKTCSLDSRINIKSERQDLSSAYGQRCWIVPYMDFSQEQYPSQFTTDKTSILGYDADYLSELNKKSFEELKRTEVGSQPSQDLPVLGEKAFVTARPSYAQLLGEEQPAPLDEAKELAMFTYKNGIVYQLSFTNKGMLTSQEPVASEELPVCSVDEAVILMQQMLGSMLGSSSTQMYSGCALTTELIEERCDINLQNNLKLFSRFINGQCEINSRDISGFAVASFKEISVEKFERLYLPSSMRSLSGIGDRAYIWEKQNGIDLYFRTGNRAGIFSVFKEPGKEEVYIFDVGTQQPLPLGGACNEEETKDIVNEVLVPYLQGE